MELQVSPIGITLFIHSIWRHNTIVRKLLYLFDPGRGNNVVVYVVIEVHVIVNTAAVIVIKMGSSFTATGCITRSRSVILKLNAGDQIFVSVTTPGCYYGNSTSYQLLFSGFRLF